MSGLTISLTSIPPRFSGLGPVLASLLDQRAATVQLWIPGRYQRFPGWDGSLPRVPPGVTLCRNGDDLGPATKLIPALERIGPNGRLLICDDDAIYAPGWAEGFLSAARDAPAAAIAASTYPVARLALDPRPGPIHRIVQGFAGVLIGPEMFADRTIAARDRLVDDIWLSAQLAASGTAIVARHDLRKCVAPLDATCQLQDARPEGLSRAALNQRTARALRAELGIWE